MSTYRFSQRLRELREIQLACGYERGWVFHSIKKEFEIGLEELTAIADTVGYKRSWIRHAYEKLQEERRQQEQSFSYSYGRSQHHYQPPNPPPRQPKLPPRVRAALKAFRLEMPFTLEELKKAYRQKAFEYHPDRGGVPEAFLVVRDCYEDLLPWVGVAV